MPQLTPTCVWRISHQLVVALDDRFGEPVDAYVNGSQVWLRDDGPNDMAIEWRLHPVPGFQRPAGMTIHDTFESVAGPLLLGEEPAVSPAALWDGLEAFPAYGDEIEPPALVEVATAALGIPPDHSGLVDHQRIGDEWERSGGDTSIVDALVAQLTAPPDPRPGN